MIMNRSRTKKNTSVQKKKGRARRWNAHSGSHVGRIRAANAQRILAAAEKVFSERGYEGATTALIAKRAGLPKANMHYYFPTKLHVYKAVIESILELWLSAFDSIRPDDNPAEAFTKYIHAKIEYSRRRPFASRVFAKEIISGAPVIRRFLSNDLRQWVQQKCGIFRHWARSGQMMPLAHPEHLFFIMWAATQTYADFSTQMCAVLGLKKLRGEDFDNGAKLLTQLVLDGCGISLEGCDSTPSGIRSARTKSGHTSKQSAVIGLEFTAAGADTDPARAR